MAIEKIIIQYEADVKKLKADLKKVEKGLGKVEKKGKDSAKKVTKSFGGLNASILKVGASLAAAFAVGKLVSFGKESLRLFDIQQKAETKLLVALKNRTDVQQRLISQAQELQEITLFGDEEIINAQAFLATMGLSEESIERLIPLVLDLATKQGLDLKSAADLIAKSVGSSTNALARYGIVIEGAVGSSERMESAVKALNTQVGGQAKAAALAGTGALTQFENIIGDLQEAIGGILIKGILPFVKGFQSMVLAVTDFISTPVSEKLEEERLEIQLLGSAILATNDNQAVRNSLIDELNTKYPEVLKNLDRENLLNKVLKERLAEVNKELLNKIIIQQKDEQLDKARKKAAELFLIQRDLVVSLTDEIGKLHKANGLTPDTNKTLVEQAKAIRDILGLTGEEVKAIGKRGTEESRAAIRKAAATNRLVNLTNKLIKAETEFEAAQQESLDILSDKQKLLLELFGITEKTTNAETKAAEKSIENAMIAGVEIVEIKRQTNKDLITLEEDLTAARGDEMRKQLTDLEIVRDREIRLAEEAAAKKLAIRRRVEDEAFSLTSMSADAIREISKNNADFELGVLNDKLEAGEISQAEFDRKSGRIKTRQAQAEKDGALFQVALSTAQAVIKAIQASPATFGMPFSAFAVAQGLIQTAVINSKPIPKYAKGAIGINGEGTGTSDSIPAMLSKGESVMTARETNTNKDALLAIRGDYFDRYIQQNYVMPMLRKQGAAANNDGRMFDDFGIIRAVKKNNAINIKNGGSLAKQIGKEVSSSNYYNERY